MPFNRKLYPKNWEELALLLKESVGWRCQGSPAYPDCRAQHGQAHPVTGSRVVLTVAHLDHNPSNNDFTNLRVWCQRCHNTYDAPHRAETRRKKKRRECSVWKNCYFGEDGRCILDECYSPDVDAIMAELATLRMGPPPLPVEDEAEKIDIKTRIDWIP